MALTHLADTSVLTRVAVPQVRYGLRPLLEGARIGRCAMTDLELGFSARSVDEWDKIRSAADAFTPVDVCAEDFRRASHIQRALAAAGLRGRKVPDLLIAATAERSKLVVLHYDGDFEHIAHITGQGQEWIVPRGSID